MSTQVTPEQIAGVLGSQDNNQGSTNPTNISNGNPQAQHTDPQVELLRQQNQLLMMQIQNMDQRFASMANAQPVQAPSAPAITYDDLVADPGKALQAAISHQVAPINAYLQKVERRDKLNQMLAGAAGHPRVAQVWPQIRTLVETQLSRVVEQREVTLQDLEAACVQAIGALAMNNGFAIPTQNSQQPSVPQIQNNVIPPNIRPNSSPLPHNESPKQKVRDFNELELRLMRERRMTPAQWMFHNNEITTEQAKQIDPNFVP